MPNRIFRFFKLIYLKLFRINDTPQKIALGLGVGVFFGTMPVTGPLVALFFAFILRVNRASALLGSILTNTWLSIPTFIVAVKAGAMVTGADYEDIRKAWQALIKNFTLPDLFKLSMYDILLPIIIGYLMISFIISITAYLIALLALNYGKKRKKVKA